MNFVFHHSKGFTQSKSGLKPRSLFPIGILSKANFNKSDFMETWEDV